MAVQLSDVPAVMVIPHVSVIVVLVWTLNVALLEEVPPTMSVVVTLTE